MLKQESIPNNVISHYKIIKKIGRGGMATVYEAFDRKNERHVALKILLPHHASDTIVRQRFIREARVGMELDHPDIVKVFETGKDKQPFLAMELVKGRPLNEIIKHKPLPLKQAIYIARRITDALGAAHQQGIIHRDIKPGNIMIADDHVKIMDFGLARVVDTTSLTEKNEIIGTLYYMSPEQVIGDTIDARSDIFSLGAVLYQMLTARHPFQGEHVGTIIHAILYSEPIRLCDIDRSMPKEVEQVVFKALQKKNHRRYQSTLDLGADLLSLDNMLDGRSVNLIASDISTEEVFESHRGVYSELIGREHEMEELQAHLTSMLQGKLSAVLLSGEAGVGKSRLVWELGQKAKKQGVHYLVGRCVANAGIPYQPILEAIRSYFDIKGINKMDALGHFIDEYAGHLRYRKDTIAALVLQETTKEAPIINKEQIWDTAAEIIKVIAQDRPIVLHLENLHWADIPTLDMLIYIIRTTTDYRILIIGTYRPEDITEETPPLRLKLKTSSKEKLLHELSLERLNKEGTQNILKSVFENSTFTDKFMDSIYKETEGNPLFILEMLKLLRDENIITRQKTGWRLSGDTINVQIPKTVTDVIVRRLKKLNRDEREIIEIAAVEGLSFQSDTLAHCLEQQRIKILRRLQNLESSHNLIHATKQGYQFDHGKIKDVVYNSLIPELRKEYHKIIGEYLAENYSNKKEYAGRIAHHLYEADLEEEALPYYQKAGKYAQQIYANEEALGYFDKGIEMVEAQLEQNSTRELQYTRINLLKGRAEMEDFFCRYDKAREDYERIKELATDLRDQKELAYTITQIGEIHSREGDYKRSLSLYEQALRIQRKIGDKQGETLSLYHFGLVQSQRAELNTKAIRSIRRALHIAKQTGNTVMQSKILGLLGQAYNEIGDYKKSLNYHKKSLDIRSKIGDKFGKSASLFSIGAVYLNLGEPRKLLKYTKQALKIYRQIGYKRGQQTCCSHIAYGHYACGEFESSLRFCKQGLEIRKETGDSHAVDSIMEVMAWIHGTRGDYRESMRYLDQALEFARNRPTSEYLVYQYLFWTLTDIGDSKGALEALRHLQKIRKNIDYKEFNAVYKLEESRVEFHKKNYDKAYSKIQEGLFELKELGTVYGIAQGLECAAATELARKNLSNAQRFAEEGLDLTRRMNQTISIACFHRLLAQIYVETKVLNKAKFQVQECLKIAKAIGMKPLLWQAHLTLGEVYLKQKQCAKAQEELKKAWAIVNEISSKLNAKMRKKYLKKKEITDIYKELRRLISKQKKGGKA